MSADPLVSVVIPVYCQLESLQIVLRFFNYQTYPPNAFEVIVVDDGSPEPIGPRLDLGDYRYSLKVITQDNRGRAAARNSGGLHARGKILIFCDADRIPDVTFVAAHAQFQERFADSAAFGVPLDCFYSVERLQACDQREMENIRKFSRKPDYFRRVMPLFTGARTSSRIAWAAFLAGNASISRRVFERIEGFDERFKLWGLEHFELGFRLQQDEIEICHNADAGSYHIPHRREAGYVETGIQANIALFAAKHSGANVAPLAEFLMGKISLREFEIRFG